MSDNAIRNAAGHRDALARRINELSQSLEDARRELAEIDRFIALWEEFSGEKPPMPTVAPKNQNKDRHVIRRTAVGGVKPVNPPKEQIGDVVERFLRERGLPATRRVLAQHLKSEGIVLHGADPDMVLSTMLWRMKDRFRRLPPHGYWLAGEPDPASLDIT